MVQYQQSIFNKQKDPYSHKPNYSTLSQITLKKKKKFVFIHIIRQLMLPALTLADICSAYLKFLPLFLFSSQHLHENIIFILKALKVNINTIQLQALSKNPMLKSKNLMSHSSKILSMHNSKYSLITNFLGQHRGVDEFLKWCGRRRKRCQSER